MDIKNTTEQIILASRIEDYIDTQCINHDGWRACVEEIIEIVAKQCIREIQSAIPRNGNTPENERSYSHIRAIKSHYEIDDVNKCTHHWVSAKNKVVQNGSICVLCYATSCREPDELNN